MKEKGVTPSTSLDQPFKGETNQTFFSKLDKLMNPDYLDNLSIQKFGIEWMFIKYDKRVRNIVVSFALIIFGIWMIAGFDSCATQFELFLLNIPNYLMNKLSWEELVFVYQDNYGKGLHYSAFVIYGIFYWGLSHYLSGTEIKNKLLNKIVPRSNLNIKGTRNFAIAFSFTLLSIAVFETFWHQSFAFWQGQSWVVMWKMPQLKILLQNLAFFTVGGMMILTLSIDQNRLYHLGKWKDQMLATRFKTNFPQLKLRIKDYWTLVFLVLTLGSIYLWYFYGDYYPVETLTVEVVGWGTWRSSPNFPQTVYTIDTDVSDNIVAGDQWFLENNLLHGVNTLCKVFMTLLIFNIARVRKDEKG